MLAFGNLLQNLQIESLIVKITRTRYNAPSGKLYAMSEHHAYCVKAERGRHGDPLLTFCILSTQTSAVKHIISS